jgi:hypothetical protein
VPEADDDDSQPLPSQPPPADEPSAPASEPTHGAANTDAGRAAAAPASAQSVVVPGQYHFLSWWKLLLALVAVWVPAAAIGLGLFTWWSSVADKTPAVFVALVYVAVTTVGSLMLAMVPNRPMVSALAIAMLTAVFASALAAAPLYAQHYCRSDQHSCIGGVIPH